MAFPALILTKLANPQQHHAQTTFRLDKKCGKYRGELIYVPTKVWFSLHSFL
jgi:hypothetical protein